MTGPFETLELEALLIDPDQTDTKVAANDGTVHLARCLAKDLSVDLGSESTPYVLDYDPDEGGAKTGLHNIVYDFTGATGEPFEVEHPAVKHLAIYENNTDDTVTVLVNGQTGVELGIGMRRILYCDGTDVIDMETSPIVSFVVAVSDETTNLTTGNAKITFRMPFAMFLTDIRINVNTASSSGLPAVDVNEGGVSIFSTTLTIDVSALTSVGATTPAVITDVDLADDAEMTVDIDTAGTGTKGLKLALIGYRTGP